MEVDRV